MQKNTMVLSRFVHLKKITDDIICLYHALLIRAVFVNFKEFDEIEYYIHNIRMAPSTDYKMISYLISNYFIVEDDSIDSQLLIECQNLIPTHSIDTVYFIVTENCNFKCQYCFISKAVQDVAHEDRTMTKNIAKTSVSLLQKIFEKYKNENTKTIIFYGGEPLLNIDIVSYIMEDIKQIQNSGIYWPTKTHYSLISNGSLLDRKSLYLLDYYKISLCISYDVNILAQSHRKNNLGENSYHQINDIIHLLTNINYPFSLSVTLTEESLTNRIEIIEKIKAIKPVSVAFNLLIPYKNSQISNQYYENATDFIIQAFEELRKYGIFEERMMRKVNAFANNSLYPYDCGASGGNQFTIRPNGDIGICHAYLNNHKYFSKQSDFQNLDILSNKYFSLWRNRSPLYMDKCQTCDCLGICGGGCPYAADVQNGSIYEIDERFCIYAKKILNWLLVDLYNNISYPQRCSDE